MKFTVVSHACLYVEHYDVRLLIDPWVIGSCYWRSWWNYPKVAPELIDKIKPTHIYITHLHWDHYHGISLRFFEKFRPTILFPKHFNKRMVNDCKRDFKFTNIIELDHGKNYSLGKDFNVTSYQFNPIIIDSSLVIEADNTTILDSNDSKVFGLSLKQILKNHNDIDFIFRSHSSATPLPQCIRGMSPEDEDRSPNDYANDFIAFSKVTKAKFAIPFASSHVYLHNLTSKFNKFYSNPEFVKKIFDSKIMNDQECVLMQSGSQWSKNNGFKIKKHNYNNLNRDIKEYYSDNKNKLNKQIELEKKLKLRTRSFHNYFHKFLNSLKFPLTLDFRFGFLIEEKVSNKLKLCIVDCRKRLSSVITINSENDIYKYHLSFVIITPIYVFNDCNSKMMHNTFTPSKLLEIILISKNSYKDLKKYFSLIDLYENDCLPINKIFTIRNLLIILRRWREIFDVFIYIYEISLKKNKIYKLYSDL